MTLVELLPLLASLSPAAVLAVLAECGTNELAALRYHWPFWGRPKQLVPSTAWRSFGLLTGRGWGKTRALSEHVNAEVEAGRARRVALIAQNEDKTCEVLVDGESGLLVTSPPWHRAKWEGGHVVWPNGAQAFVYTPEVPGALRGPEHDLAWASEVATWPAGGRDEAFSNLRLGLRLGYGRLIWDATPRRRHPLIRYLLERSKKHPARHVVVRGSTYENAANLTPEAIEEWITEYGGTQRGREELDGEYLDSDEGALWRQEWIDRARRDMPAKLARRILSIDPAISMRKGTDKTGLLDMGLGLDEQIFVIEDLTGKLAWEVWGPLVIERYVRHQCDCIVAERNRGGDAVVANLRACARERGLRVEVIEAKAVSRHAPGTIYVKEIVARTSKESRHEPVASLYEAGRVSHVNGGNFAELEDVMTTWEPTPNALSPDELDALSQGAWELAGLGEKRADPRVAFQGIATAAKALKAQVATAAQRGGASTVLARLGRGTRSSSRL